MEIEVLLPGVVGEDTVEEREFELSIENLSPSPPSVASEAKPSASRFFWCNLGDMPDA